MTRAISSYVALGDSLTHGTDPEREGRWPDEVAAALGCRYTNLAKVGATSREVEGEEGGGGGGRPPPPAPPPPPPLFSPHLRRQRRPRVGAPRSGGLHAA